MYCSECGTQATGKFCTECGTPLKAGPANADRTGDWSQIIDYRQLLQHADVRERIAQAAAESTAGVSGEEVLAWCESALTPLTVVPIPFASLAKVVQPLHAKLGIKTGKHRVQALAEPPGRVLVGVLCSLARHGRKLLQVRQLDGGCLLDAELASDIFALAGKLHIVIRPQGGGTLLEIATDIPGQIFDWGKSSRCLDQLLTEAQSSAALPSNTPTAA